MPPKPLSLCGSVNSVQATAVSDVASILKKYKISKCEIARILGLLELYENISPRDRSTVKNSLCGSVNSIPSDSPSKDVAAILNGNAIDICKLQDILKNEAKYNKIIKEIDKLTDADKKAIKKMGSK